MVWAITRPRASMHRLRLITETCFDEDVVVIDACGASSEQLVSHASTCRMFKGRNNSSVILKLGIICEERYCCDDCMYTHT